MTTTRKIGIGLSILGALMFLTAASLFTYRGSINPIVSKIGMYSFMLWLPAIILGVILIAVGKRRREVAGRPK
ncbi:hypothetical protein [Maribellus sp. YY47]|uniref:hypothetical protein n=1 Tax=Maribellus sp. YY47 TaxID=2929486 RepID=UPI002000F6D0|nr:hypothetical protein [Maribellus sp. YY47]MCK3685813.1 hypothetical protein [Maribellus sp. YY47]